MRKTGFILLILLLQSASAHATTPPPACSTDPEGEVCRKWNEGINNLQTGCEAAKQKGAPGPGYVLTTDTAGGCQWLAGKNEHDGPECEKAKQGGAPDSGYYLFYGGGGNPQYPEGWCEWRKYDQ